MIRLVMGHIWMIVAATLLVGSALATSQFPTIPFAPGDAGHDDGTHGSGIASQTAEAASLPLAIDWANKLKERVGDAEVGTSYIKIEEGYIDAENHCEMCTRIEYIPGPQGEAGLAYELDKALDLSNAKSVTFFVMGEDGGEKVKFKVAGKNIDGITDDDVKPSPRGGKGANSDAPANAAAAAGKEKAPKDKPIIPPGLFKNQKFALDTEEVALNNDWKKYSVDVAGADLKEITHPFGLEIFNKKGGQKQVIFLKHVVYDTDPAEFNLLSAAPENATLALTSAPMATEIVANMTNATAPATIEFEGNASGGSPPYSFHWEFGNGSQGDGEAVTGIFAEPGSYNVTLTAIDSMNQTALSSIVVDIAEPATTTAATAAQASDPLSIMGMIANATEGQSPATIEFEADVAGGTEPYAYDWDYGDGSPPGGEGEAGQSAVHTFEEAGEYNVTLTATDSNGTSALSAILVNITGQAAAAEEEEEVMTAEEEGSLADGPPLNVTDDADNEDDTDLAGELQKNSTTEGEDSAEENTPPVARVIDGLVAYLGDRVMLDGLGSFDEDGDQITYEWSQSDGPDAEITGADTATPVIEIPSDLTEDDEITMDLVVSDGTQASETESVTISVDYVDVIDSNREEGGDSDTIIVEEQTVKPQEQRESEWDSECDDLVECLSDDEENTFASEGNDGQEDIERMDAMSFEGLEIPEDREIVDIEYIAIQVDAAKTGQTGFIRFVIDDDDDDDEFASDLISIASDDMASYGLVLEEDPRTDESWTADSLDSLVAGYSYGGGESEVRISEIRILVAYTTAEAEVATAAEEEAEEEPEQAETNDDNGGGEESAEEEVTEEEEQQQQEEEETETPEEAVAEEEESSDTEEQSQDVAEEDADADTEEEQEESPAAEDETEE